MQGISILLDFGAGGAKSCSPSLAPQVLLPKSCSTSLAPQVLLHKACCHRLAAITEQEGDTITAARLVYLGCTDHAKLAHRGRAEALRAAAST
jgi:hypothetical protein